MSMSTNVTGFKPPDKKWKKMYKAFNACMEAEIEPSQELWDFFDGDIPDEAGVVVNISSACKDFSADMEEGFQIEISKLPKDVKYIRFVNSF